MFNWSRQHYWFKWRVQEIEAPFSRGTVVGAGIGDPTTILARGSTFHAWLLSYIAIMRLRHDEDKATTHTLGVYALITRRRARKWEESCFFRCRADR